MKTTNKKKTTEIFRVALQNVTSMSPNNVVFTLTLLDKEKGDEMYGM